MSLADCDRGQNVEEPVEDSLRRLRRALTESFADSICPRLIQNSPGPGFGDCAKRTNGERGAEDSQVVVVYLVSKTGIADLVEALELVKVDGISVRHNESVECDRNACLTKRLHW